LSVRFFFLKKKEKKKEAKMRSMKGDFFAPSPSRYPG
jgi:hypothetical protein